MQEKNMKRSFSSIKNEFNHSIEAILNCFDGVPKLTLKNALFSFSYRNALCSTKCDYINPIGQSVDRK